jgi:uncharacterized protein YdcH (DUF465 family)
MDGIAGSRIGLVQQDPQYRRLAEKHQEYEERLGQLQTRRWLSEEERVEEVTLKKLKLAVKDEMEAMLRRGNG